MAMSVLVTGGAGFIGSNFVHMLTGKGIKPVVLDKLTYAGHLPNIKEVLGQCAELVKGDIADTDLVRSLFSKHNFDYVVNFAAESHVDNSISGPKPFVDTNILGTFSLLEAAREAWKSSLSSIPGDKRFLHVSTDEVFGELDENGYFTEESRYQPNSPTRQPRPDLITWSVPGTILLAYQR